MFYKYVHACQNCLEDLSQYRVEGDQMRPHAGCCMRYRPVKVLCWHQACRTAQHPVMGTAEPTQRMQTHLML